VGGALNDLLAYYRTKWVDPIEFWIATAYINPGGFGLVADELEQVGRARLLIGAEPEPPIARVRPLTEETDADRVRRALEGHERSLAEDRNLLGFTYEADRSARRFIDWLRSGKVEVRRYENGFLHGKAYLVSDSDEGAIAASSNFTFAGLGRNWALTRGRYDPTTVREVREWYEGLWDDSAPYGLAAVYEGRYEPHSPYLISLRVQWELYGTKVEAIAKAT